MKGPNSSLLQSIPKRARAMGDDLLVEGLGKTKHLFFTGKGGNGKTSMACATAIALAERGKRVLLVSTDPASNLDEVLGHQLSRSVEEPTKVTTVANLWAANIDPDQSAAIYREKVLGNMKDRGESQKELDRVGEQLAGQCTVEIAAFDEFAGLLSCGTLLDGAAIDHIVFDTAPTGHTLRLLALPAAWTTFFDGNQQGASCLGPVSALKNQKSRFELALASLKDAASTTVYLVTRPESRAIGECARTWEELLALGIGNQRVIVNGVLPKQDGENQIVASMLEQQQKALAGIPKALGLLVVGHVPLRPFNVVGVDRLRTILLPSDVESCSTPMEIDVSPVELPALEALVQDVVAGGSGLVMVMGKGGVGKTTIAVALALALVERGCSVHLSTTDPAAHVQATLNSDQKLENLRVSSVDPVAVTQKYIDEAVAARGPMSDSAKALLLEDLRSPCTEEIAVFEAFGELIAEAQRPDQFVVLDTAPTGHTLLLMDATGSYDREVQKKTTGTVTPLHILRDAALTKVILATLPETTPISEAMRLRDDLGRAGIKPHAWVLNHLLPKGIADNPLLSARAALQRQQASRLAGERVFQVPSLPVEPTGPLLLKQLIGEGCGPKFKQPLSKLPQIDSVAAFKEKRQCADPLAVLFDAGWAKGDELRVFVRWLAAQVGEGSVAQLRADSDEMEDLAMDEKVMEFPTLCFYSGGKLAAKADAKDLAGAKQAAQEVFAVFGAKAQSAPMASQPKSTTPAMTLPKDLRESGAMGAC
jgi:arsenite-transporting ATPase